MNPTPPSTPFPKDRHGLIYHAAAMAAGFTDDQYRTARRRGEIVAVVRGVCVESADRTPEQLHRLQALAIAEMRSADIVLSHQSAAVMHGLEMLKPNLKRVHSTTTEANRGYRTASQHRHVGPVPHEQIVVVDGHRVTSLERTAVDIACTASHGFAGALAVFDSALRRGADPGALRSILAHRRRQGAAHARRALSWADGRAESPGESWSRAQMIDAGVLSPRLQHEFFDDTGEFIARTDFDWAGRVVGEFDGMGKYLRDRRKGETIEQTVLREKAREDALRAQGIMVIRWIWDDLECGRVVEKVLRWLTRVGLTAA